MNKRGTSRWPARPGQPKPRITARATERVTRLDALGRKTASEFWFRGQLVGRAFWNPDGTSCVALGVRNGVPVDHQLEFDERGVVHAEPFVDGKVHGLAKQFGTDGRLLLVSPFKHGTGTDFWCDERGHLAEEHPLVDGRPSGAERWWNEDQKTVYSETEWLNGEWHGATRHWTAGRLDRGFPKLFVRGRRVSRRAYIELAHRDRTLPPFRPEADSPVRTLPRKFLQLRERARRMRGARR